MYRMPLPEQDLEQQFDHKILTLIEMTIIPRIGDPRVGDSVIVSICLIFLCPSSRRPFSSGNIVPIP